MRKMVGTGRVCGLAFLVAVAAGCGEGGATGSGFWWEGWTGGGAATGGAGGSGAGSAGEMGGTGGAGGSGESTSSSGGALETLVVMAWPDLPLPGRTVIVNDAAGQWVETRVTDEQGRIETDVPEGGSATVAYAAGALANGQVYTARHLRTVTDIRDGSTVVLQVDDLAPSVPQNAPMGNLTISVEGSVPAGTDHYRLQLSCGVTSTFSGPVKTASNYRGCPGKSSYDVFVFARDDGGTVLAAGYLLDQPLTPGAPAFHAMSLGTLLGDVLVKSKTFGVPGPQVAAMTLTGYREAQPTSGVAADHVDLSPSSWGLDAHLRLPVVPFAKFSLHQLVAFEDEQGISGVLGHLQPFGELPPYAEWYPKALARVAMLPPADFTEPARPRVAWTLGEYGYLGQVMIGSLEWGWSSSAFEHTTWTFFAPADGAPEVRLPELPDELAAYRPTGGDQVDGPRVEHHHTDGLDGYGAHVAVPHLPAGRFPLEPAKETYAVLSRFGME